MVILRGFVALLLLCGSAFVDYKVFDLFKRFAIHAAFDRVFLNYTPVSELTVYPSPDGHRGGEGYTVKIGRYIYPIETETYEKIKNGKWLGAETRYTKQPMFKKVE